MKVKLIQKSLEEDLDQREDPDKFVLFRNYSTIGNFYILLFMR